MRPSGKVSLRAGILMALLIVSLLPVFIVSSASRVLLQRAFERNAREALQATADEAARDIANLLTGIHRDFLALLKQAATWDPVNSPDECVESIETWRAATASFADITLFDHLGNGVLSTSGRYWEPVRYTKWFEEALKGSVVITPPTRIPGMSGIYLSMYALVPGRSADKRLVLVAHVPFSLVSDLLTGLRVGRREWLVLLDSRGNALHHPDSRQIFQRVLGHRPARWWQAQPHGLLKADKQDIMLYATAVVSSLHTGGEPWYIVSLLPYADVIAPLEDYRIVLAVATLITLVAVILAGFVLSHGLAKPLGAIMRAAQRVAEGDLTIRLREIGAIELCDLARAFNQMIEQLRQYREHVESVVEHRTARLRESQVQLEERATYLRASLESLMDGMLIVRWPDGRVLAANHPFAELFNLTDKEPLTGRFLAELEEWINPSMADQRKDRFEWNALQTQPESISLEEWEVAKPVRKVLSVSSTAAIGPNGVVLARLYMFRDLTEQRQLQEELRQAQKMEAVGRLAGGIAHDFNNLLTGILGNLSMADMEPAGSPHRDELIHSARLAAQRASELVRQLLSFSRRSQLRLQPVDVNQVVEEVHSLLRHSADPRIELVGELESKIWRVRADAIQIQQVLMNLCVNAIDAMPQGGQLKLKTANVRITAEQAKQWLDAKPGEYVRVSVSDQGHGMSQEVQSHLFEPFFTTKEPGKGTGLGLAMSYGIIRQHDGWITCYSELNRGTTFHIFLPRLVGELAEETQGVRPEPVRGGNERVLVVDDEPAVRAVVIAILQRYGYSVMQAAHGEEALHLLEQMGDKPDVVILDMTMPKLSGAETLRRLRQRYPKLPVIISSGYPIDLDSFEREAGVRPDGVVQKPYEIQLFAKTLRDVLDRADKS